jgi:3-isopropylmalate/(R)-2-methylmalate dehydratase small subunit
MEKQIVGKAYVVGRDIDTDVIIPAKYLNDPNPAFLAKHAMEGLDPKQYPVPFLNKDGTCDYRIIIAGYNFGCGSSREHAPIALAAAGIQAVVAPTFARIYYRNSINGGARILPLESTLDIHDLVQTGEEIEINLETREVLPISRVGSEFDRGKGLWPIRDFGPAREIIEAGGLTAYNKRRLGLVKAIGI